MIVLNTPQGTDEWLHERAGAFTASRFADARSRLTRKSKSGDVGDLTAKAAEYAWTVALERIAGKPLDQTFTTWQMRRGSELEPEARMAYELATGLIAGESGLILTDDRKFGYSSDGLVGDTGLIEIKCPANCQKIGLTLTDPDEAVKEYIDQIQGGMWLTGRKWCDFVMYCPWLAPVGKDLFIKRIHRDERFIRALAEDLQVADAFAERFRRQVSTARTMIDMTPAQAPAQPEQKRESRNVFETGAIA